jgi:hypothetical protein
LEEGDFILSENGQWHSLNTCVWKSPNALQGFQDVSKIYYSLEDFFVRRLGVGIPSPSKLIDEVRKMAEASEPQIAKLRSCLVDIGMMLAGGAIDQSVASSLDALKQTKFLPKRSVKGLSILVKVTDDFAIPDHLSYSQALAKRGILLDFDLHETQTLHSLFKYMDISPPLSKRPPALE